MSNKNYDHRKEATHLAKVLKYNPELTTDTAKFDDLVVALEVRLMEAFHAGQGGKTLVEGVYEAPGVSAEILPPPVPTGVSN